LLAWHNGENMAKLKHVLKSNSKYTAETWHGNVIPYFFRLPLFNVTVFISYLNFWPNIKTAKHDE